MTNIKEIQKRLLEIALSVTQILEKHRIKYLITYGTLLGAVRHHGFIPWDDDFDLFLIDDEYDVAMDVLKTELPTNLLLEDQTTEPKFFHGWNRVKDKLSRVNCSFYQHDNIYQNKGLMLDLYRLKKMYESEVDSYRIKEALSYLDRRKKVKNISYEEYEVKRNELLSSLYKLKEKDSYENKEIMATLPVGRQLEINDVFPLVKYKFEDFEFYGPNNAHNVLSHFYGVYMELPPEGKRKSHYDSVEFLGG